MYSDFCPANEIIVISSVIRSLLIGATKTIVPCCLRYFILFTACMKIFCFKKILGRQNKTHTCTEHLIIGPGGGLF